VNEYIDKLDNQQTLAMLIEIDNRYKRLSLKIPAPIYDKQGRLRNIKEVKNALKKIQPQIQDLWNDNLNIIDKYSKTTMTNNFILFEIAKIKLDMKSNLITEEAWYKTQNKLLLARHKKIKIKQVINGNARILNKRVQTLVNDMYKNGKSWVQTKKALQQEYGYNAGRAKRIAITEKLYYKSEAQLQGIKGLDVYKTWIYNNKAKEPRIHHEEADKKVVRGATKEFQIGAYRTQAPQHFGLPSEDINCHCTMRIDLTDEVSIAPKEIREAIEQYKVN
jgi:hypothetical protein